MNNKELPLDARTFSEHLLGVCGLTYADFIYIKQGRETFEIIKRQMEERDRLKGKNESTFR